MTKLMFLIALCISWAVITPNEASAQLKLDMIFLQGGIVTLGDSTDGVRSDTLKDFYISKYEITNEQFAEFLNHYDSDTVKDGKYSGEKLVEEFGHGLNRDQKVFTADSIYRDCPVVMITWYGAKEFCRYYGYRLPTRAEWEFAARSGNKNIDYRYHGNNKDDLNEWMSGKPKKQPENPLGLDPSPYLPKGYPKLYVSLEDINPGRKIPIGSKRPNPIGIYEMPGYLREWCDDHDDFNIGGYTWYTLEGNLHMRYGRGLDTQDGNKNITFRCVKNAN